MFTLNTQHNQFTLYKKYGDISGESGQAALGLLLLLMIGGAIFLARLAISTGKVNKSGTKLQENLYNSWYG